jgi:hypothetical protein
MGNDYFVETTICRDYCETTGNRYVTGVEKESGVRYVGTVHYCKNWKVYTVHYILYTNSGNTDNIVIYIRT